MSEPNENSLPPGARKLLPKEGAHEVTSIVAYLIGVPKRIFENDFEPLELDVFTSLEKNKNARIIRHLCILRTSIERNYKYINQEMKFNYKSLLSLTEYVPYDSINQLSIDGISFIKNTSTEPRHHIIEINRIISDRINNCKDLFPIWLNWQYLRELFVMPNGLTEQGTKIAADTFHSNMSYYPY